MARVDKKANFNYIYKNINVKQMWLINVFMKNVFFFKFRYKNMRLITQDSMKVSICSY